MTESQHPNAPARLAPAGLILLAITSIGWGINWPISKYLLTTLPPLTVRGCTGVIGALCLAVLALTQGQSLKVRRELWPRLMLAALLNVTGWMVLIGLALLWLPASETALIAYTMPVWAAIIAWPVLGERPTWLRVVALALAFAGLAVIMGGNGFTASAAKLPGILMALTGAIGFALGTVLAKKLPLQLPPFSAAAWQVGLGCFPVAVAGLLIETTHPEALTPYAWLLLLYSVGIAFCVCYITWFAALARLPASVAAIGTTAVPVIGVIGADAARTVRDQPDRRPGPDAGRCRAGGAIVSGAPKPYRRSARGGPSGPIASCDRVLSKAARLRRAGHDARSHYRYSPRCTAPSCPAGVL